MSKAPRDAKKSTNVNSPVSDAPAGLSQTPAPRGTGVAVTGPSRIVGSQAKKQEEVTRQGTQKMKWVVVFASVYSVWVSNVLPL